LIAQKLIVPTLFLVPGKDLLHQTYERFCKRLGFSCSDKEVGRIGDGKWQPGTWITIATVASLYHNRAKAKTQEFLDKIDLMFIDECHKAASDSWYEVARMCNAWYRYGLSGTPLKRTDGADIKLVGVTGPIVVEIRNKFLIERGVSVPVEIEFLDVKKPTGIHPKTPYQDVYKACIVDNVYRNKQFVQRIHHHVDQGRQGIALVKEIDHGVTIDKMLWSMPKTSFTTHQFIHGKESSEIRQTALKNFAKGDLKVLIATKILGEGIDLPSIDFIAKVGGGKSSIETLQHVGRGMRKGGQGKLIVIDSVDYTHRYLTEHSLQRLEDYRGEDCFTIRKV
jgi:superfamily II DNA or RNA helicase